MSSHITDTARWRQNLQLRFGLRFIALAAPLSLFYGYPRQSGAVHDLIQSYLAAYASVAGHLIALFDSDVRVSGTQIIGAYSLEIVKNCDAMDVQLLLASAVLAFPAPLKQRSLGVVLGAVGVACVNIVRIASLYFIGARAPASFEFWHREAWPLVLVLFALLVFLSWVNWQPGERFERGWGRARPL